MGAERSAHLFGGAYQAASQRDPGRPLARETQKNFELHLENATANEKTLDVVSANSAGVPGGEQVTMYVAVRGRPRDCVRDRSAGENSHAGTNFQNFEGDANVKGEAFRMGDVCVGWGGWVIMYVVGHERSSGCTHGCSCAGLNF